MSFQNRLDELNERRDQGQEEIDKMNDQGSQLYEDMQDQGNKELEDLQDQYEAELEQMQNEGDAYEDEGDYYDRVQAEAEMQMMYGLDDNHDLTDGFDDSDGGY